MAPAGCDEYAIASVKRGWTSRRTQNKLKEMVQESALCQN